MTRVAVITGASSGLGALFAKELDSSPGKVWQIDEFCLIARREDKLREVAASLTHPSTVLPLDLSKGDSASSAAQALMGKTVVCLINCAGFGRIGTMDSISREDSDNMIALNCRAPVDLTAALLPLMARGSCIVNVASVAAFQPFQHLGVYAATKAFVLSWSRALRWELRPRGIHVTAVCPYWMRGTEFIARAQRTADESRPQTGGGKDANHDSVNDDNKDDGKNTNQDGGKVAADIKHFPLCDKPDAAVRAALRGARRNKAVVTCSAVGVLHRALCKILPREWMQGVWEVLRRV